MRKKEGFREVAMYLTEEEYALLEKYWRFQTQHKHVGTAAKELLVSVLREGIDLTHG